MRKIAMCILAISLVVPPVWGEVTTAKKDDYTLRITETAYKDLTRNQVEMWLASAEKAVQGYRDILKDMDEKGIKARAVTDVE